MADQLVMGQSPAQVAYRLLHDVARAEKKLDSHGLQIVAPDRKWILETYAECRKAVVGLKSEF